MESLKLNISVDTLYYLEGADKELNTYVSQHADLVQSLMGKGLFAYTLLVLPREHAVEEGCFYCRTLPQDDTDGNILRCKVESAETLQQSLSSFGRLVYEANITSLQHDTQPDTLYDEPVERRAPLLKQVFRSLNRKPPSALGSAPRMEIPDAELCMPAQRIEDKQYIDNTLDTCLEETPTCFRSAEQPDIDKLRLLALKIRDEILELQRQNGISVLVSELGDDFIQSLTALTDTSSLAPLVIDDRFRIILNDKEVSMPTLSRVVYMLFLLHEEGIRLKEIADYKDELLNIYLTVSPRGDLEQMNKSIKDLTDLESGSLNQKISRITAAFRQLLPSDLAQHYIITGPRGEARKIMLSRSLVTLPSELICLKG